MKILNTRRWIILSLVFLLLFLSPFVFPQTAISISLVLWEWTFPITPIITAVATLALVFITYTYAKAAKDTANAAEKHVEAAQGLIDETKELSRATKIQSRVMQKQNRTLAAQLELARAPVITLSQRTEDYQKIEHDVYDFFLEMKNQSRRHARVNLLVNIYFGERCYIHPSDHYNGEFEWSIEANSPQGATVLQKEIFEELGRHNIIEKTLRKKWNALPDLSYNDRSRESVFALVFDIIYAPIDPTREIQRNDILNLPPRKWYWDFQYNKWSKEVTPSPWKDDGINLRELAKQPRTLHLSPMGNGY